MATRPITGDTAWGTSYDAYEAISHNSDGTFKTAAVAATFTPTAYAGEESVTLPNGLVMKMGIVTMSADPTTVTFGTAFDTAVISVNVTAVKSGTSAITTTLDNVGVASFQIKDNNFGTIDSFYWMAIGY